MTSLGTLQSKGKHPWALPEWPLAPAQDCCSKSEEERTRSVCSIWGGHGAPELWKMGFRGSGLRDAPGALLSQRFSAWTFSRAEFDLRNSQHLYLHNGLLT